MLYVTILYPAPRMEARDVEIRALIARYGGKEIGSGLGLGERDIVCIFAGLDAKALGLIADCLASPNGSLGVRLSLPPIKQIPNG